MGYSRTKTDIVKKNMVEALEKSLGVVTTAARSIGLSRGLHYQWLKEDPDYKLACESIEGVAIDFAESQLHKQIQAGNPASTIFFLKTKGRKRGYSENSDINLDVKKLEIEYVGKDEDNLSRGKD